MADLTTTISAIAERWIYRTAHNGPRHLCQGIAADVVAALASSTPESAVYPAKLDREAIARVIWARFAPSHSIGFDEESRAEYLQAADAILALSSAPESSSKPGCTCHPDDKPPTPCPQKYALTECRKAATDWKDEALWALSKAIRETECLTVQPWAARDGLAISVNYDGIARALLHLGYRHLQQPQDRIICLNLLARAEAAEAQVKAISALDEARQADWHLTFDELEDLHSAVAGVTTANERAVPDEEDRWERLALWLTRLAVACNERFPASWKGLPAPTEARSVEVPAVPPEGQRALDLVWRSIDALGGAHSRADRESGFAEAYDNALTAACAAVETLGGRPNW